MTSIMQGDCIEVTLRGMVEWVSRDGKSVDLALVDGSRRIGVPTDSAKVIPPPLKVGDMVAIRDRDGDLSPHSIVGGLVKLPNGGWFDLSTEAIHDPLGLRAPREVRFLA